MRRYLTKENIFYSVVLLLFISLSIIISVFHEHWADEANTWLIANDLSIIEMIKYIHLDGHPILFHLIIKLFCLFGLKYKYFSVISILFSSLGVAILLFKSKFKWYIKMLLPFTYFIFYQYTIVVRGYTLILFLLGLIAIVWKKKKEKCILFTFLLTLLLSSEAYTFIIAGSLYLIFIINYIQDYIKSKKHNIKYLLCLVFLFIAFLLTTLYVMPRGDNTFNPHTYGFCLSDSFITSFGASASVKIILSVIVLLVFVIIYAGSSKENRIQALIITVPLLLFMMLKYVNLWHYGILFLLSIFLFWIHDIESNKILNIFLIIVSVFQIYYSINTSLYDYNNNYDSGYDIAEFIKKYDYKNLKIYGYEFHVSSVNAYFDKNIFFNWKQDVRFFYWSRSNIYYHMPYSSSFLKTNNVDMFITIRDKKNFNSELFKNNYNEYFFDGYTYFQNRKYEPMTGYVYVRKDIDIQKEKTPK